MAYNDWYNQFLNLFQTSNTGGAVGPVAPQEAPYASGLPRESYGVLAKDVEPAYGTDYAPDTEYTPGSIIQGIGSLSKVDKEGGRVAGAPEPPAIPTLSAHRGSSTAYSPYQIPAPNYAPQPLGYRNTWYRQLAGY